MPLQEGRTGSTVDSLTTFSKTLALIRVFQVPQGLLDSCRKTEHNNAATNTCTPSANVKMQECPLCHETFSRDRAAGLNKRAHTVPGMYFAVSPAALLHQVCVVPDYKLTCPEKGTERFLLNHWVHEAIHITE